ncbi:MAG: hypothetical protein AB7H86_22320 [Blastocatellales bacterium]
MFTIFTAPKAFNGHIAMIQENAIASWRKLNSNVEIILFGNETGVSEMADKYRAIHISDIDKNKYGTPLISDLFNQAKRHASHNTLCFINSDIILMSDFISALNVVNQDYDNYLMIGHCWNLDIDWLINFADEDVENKLKQQIFNSGSLRDAYSIDYFVFPKSHYSIIPDFAIGRGWFDHWLIWKSRNLGAVIVDATKSVKVIHQNHDYSHVAGGKIYAHRGKEAQENLDLAGGPKHLCTIYNATHKLINGKLKRDVVGSYLPRKTKEYFNSLYINALSISRPFRHAVGLRYYDSKK